MTAVPTGRTALYARLSKGEDPSVETQLLELRAWAKSTGTKATEYTDEISSRATPRDTDNLGLPASGHGHPVFVEVSVDTPK